VDASAAAVCSVNYRRCGTEEEEVTWKGEEDVRGGREGMGLGGRAIEFQEISRSCRNAVS